MVWSCAHFFLFGLPAFFFGATASLTSFTSAGSSSALISFSALSSSASSQTTKTPIRMSSAGITPVNTTMKLFYQLTPVMLGHTPREGESRNRQKPIASIIRPIRIFAAAFI